jgi:hypothetical protein
MGASGSLVEVLLRRAPGENFLPACSVVLGTFRKLADRIIFVLLPLALQGEEPGEGGFLITRLRTSEMLHPRTRSHA